MAVNNLRRTLNLVRDLNANGDVVDASLSDSSDTLPSLSFPSITSVHPTANVSAGDIVYLVGSNFGQYANVILISNTGVETVAGNVTFNSSSNVTFSWPFNVSSQNSNPYDIRLKIRSTGLSNVSFNTASANVRFITYYQGVADGYFLGGVNSAATATLNEIERYSLSVDTNSTDVGDLTAARQGLMGHASSTHGYGSGGSPAVPGSPVVNIIEKFPFASDTNASDVGDLTGNFRSGVGNMSTTHGYRAGGNFPSSNVIEKFSLSSDANATDVGDLTQLRQGPASNQSETHGYSAGGLIYPALSNIIDKYPFATDTNATDVGDLLDGDLNASGTNSSTTAYVAGADPNYGDTQTDRISKYPFATDSNAVDSGANLTLAKNTMASSSSSLFGFYAGGTSGNPGVRQNVIEKFSFADETDSVDIADLTAAKAYPNNGGIQV